MLGFKTPPNPKFKAKKAVSGALPALTPIGQEKGPDARNASLQPVMRKKPALVVGLPEEGLPAEVIPEEVIPEEGLPLKAKPLVAEAKAKPLVAEAIPAEGLPLKAKATEATANKPKSERKVKVKPLPEDTPVMPDTNVTPALQELLEGKDPLVYGPKVPAAGYRPINSPYFPDFIIQTFDTLSPFFAKARAAVGEAEVSADEGPDPDACKNRQSQQLETFYYQNFVRDYLTRSSPYRGLLVYHGLGSGKTCTSIAAAEALHAGGQKKIIVLTPATLSNNYRKDLGKCGYFPFRQNNLWKFLKTAGVGDAPYTWLTDLMGLPPTLVEAQGGGWVPDPEKPSNWADLTDAMRKAIKDQQAAHMNYRFRFIHYNGIPPGDLAREALAAARNGGSMFDNATVIIDEIHNLVRTINGTRFGSRTIGQFMEAEGEAREPTWSAAKGRAIENFQYPRGYTLYRLLQNAVGMKLVALSATPMINYAQEFAILLNIIGGEQRMVEIEMKGGDKAAFEAWAKKRPDVDFFNTEKSTGQKMVLNLTPVPFGFKKVVGEDYGNRGFVRDPLVTQSSVTSSRERKLDAWSASLLADMTTKGLSPGAVKLHVLPMLPDDGKVFVDNFINRATLEINYSNVLRARSSGLISYYRGGGDELMPRSTSTEVRVPMSDYMFKEYTLVRSAELAVESPPEEEGDGGAKKAKGKGRTTAEQDLYDQATTSKDSGFLIFSRAACNWVFPPDAPKPSAATVAEKKKLLGIKQPTIVAANLVLDDDVDFTEEAAPTNKKAEEAEAQALRDYSGPLLAELKLPEKAYLSAGLSTFSPKYLAIIEKLRTSRGPALVYSNFKTFEGLGIFAAALEASPEAYVPLDIQKVDGVWEIPAVLMTPGKNRYILYTGDQAHDKRLLLLQLYNADLASLPPRLAAQAQELLGAAVDNRDGRICRVFMITQSGAEGISLFNTRQVHVMEPYWNNVRIQQVIGRAIRLCSHMNLDWDDRVVDIYNYLSVFSDAQKAEGSKEIMQADKFKTTDEVLLDIALSKQKLANGLVGIAQSAAVDCSIHNLEHSKGIEKSKQIKCFKYAAGTRPSFLYHPYWATDIAETQSRGLGLGLGLGLGE